MLALHWMLLKFICRCSVCSWGILMTYFQHIDCSLVVSLLYSATQLNIIRQVLWLEPACKLNSVSKQTLIESGAQSRHGTTFWLIIRLSSFTSFNGTTQARWLPKSSKTAVYIRTVFFCEWMMPYACSGISSICNAHGRCNGLSHKSALSASAATSLCTKRWQELLWSVTHRRSKTRWPAVACVWQGAHTALLCV